MSLTKSVYLVAVSLFLGLPLVIGGVALCHLLVLEVFFGPNSLWQPPTPAYEVASWFAVLVCIVGVAVLLHAMTRQAPAAPSHAPHRMQFLCCLSILCAVYVVGYVGARASHVILYNSNTDHPVAEKRSPSQHVGSDFGGGWLGRVANLGFKPIRRVEQRYHEYMARVSRAPAT